MRALLRTVTGGGSPRPPKANANANANAPRYTVADVVAAWAAIKSVRTCSLLCMRLSTELSLFRGGG